MNDKFSVPPEVVVDCDRHLKSDKTEPIAVVGFSFQFPQEAINSDAFWQVLRNKRCVMTEWPRDRVNIDAFHHPDSKRPDTVQSYTWFPVVLY